MPSPDALNGPTATATYARAFEAGALAALDHITDQRPDLEHATMATAEHIGRVIENLPPGEEYR